MVGGDAPQASNHKGHKEGEGADGVCGGLGLSWEVQRTWGWWGLGGGVRGLGGAVIRHQGNQMNGSGLTARRIKKLYEKERLK